MLNNQFKCIVLLGITTADGINCPGQCPPACDDTQVICDGGFDDNGCEMPKACADSAGTL